MTRSTASRLISLFGGVRATARATGLDKAVVCRWDSDGVRGYRGKIPPRFNGAVMKAARKEGFPAQAKVLLDWTCAECGGKIREG